MTTTQGEHAQTELAHELFAAAQLAPGEGIEDAVSRIAAALTAAPVVQAEQLHITHGPLMRHAAALLRSRKPVLPDHESVAAELELAVEGHPTPSGEPSAEWLEVMRIATTPAQPAAPQGVAYAELPASYQSSTLIAGNDGCTVTFHFGAGGEADVESWLSAVTERASHGQAPAAQEHTWGCRANAFGACSCGQAPAGAAPDSDAMDEARSNVFDSVIEDLQERVERTNYPGNEIYILALREAIAAIRAAQPSTKAQAAPAAGAVGWVHPDWRAEQGQGRIYGHNPGGYVALAPTAPAAQADSVLEDAARSERERICAAIKAEDDYCVYQGDYMLDSDDCIKIVRGEWVRPDFSVNAARKQGGA